MAYPAFALANTILKKTEALGINDVSPMKLQKLMYYTVATYAAINNNQMLIDEFFQKWTYGPVLPSVYHVMKGSGSCPISGRYCEIIDFDSECGTKIEYIGKEDTEVHNIIDQVLEKFGRLSAIELSNLTHMNGTAWSKSSDTITPEAMAEEMKSKWLKT